MAKADLTAQRLRELLDYDRETGVFKWRKPTSNRVKVGAEVGNLNAGRLETSILGVRTNAHRLAWLYVHGEWPEHEIDHIDGNPLNNRIANLRDVQHRTNIENQGQKPRQSMSGLIGAHWSTRHKLYCARIKSRGKVIYLGWHKTAEDAHQAYLVAKRKLHEGCTI